MMLDVSDTGGQTMAAYAASQPELISDPSFDDPLAWTTSLGGWVVADGKATANGTNSASVYLTSALLEVGATYEVEFVVSDYTSGNVRPIVGDYSDIVGISGPGSYTATVQLTHGNSLGFRSASFVGSITSISVKEISSHAAIAPSDSACPNLASYNSPISSREVLTTTYSWTITDGGRA